MATSPAHKWGQIIGDLFEEGIRERLQEFADEHGLYLDFKRKRSARSGVKVRWKDKYGNFHDLDYVLEKGGSESAIGIPCAFIEVAWRRYTKHSKNKAQEIEGAVGPLLETFSESHPFLGAVLSGEFTGNSLNQLRSKGFNVLYVPYASIVQAFTQVGIDASTDESTPASDFDQKISQWESADQDRVKNALFGLHKEEVDAFFESLESSINRRIMLVRVLALHGSTWEVESVNDAIEYIRGYEDEKGTPSAIDKFEIEIRYNNGDQIRAEFRTKKDAIAFLSSQL